MNACAVCGREICENDDQCALFWKLDLFWFEDFGNRHDDDPDSFEDLEAKYDRD